MATNLTIPAGESIPASRPPVPKSNRPVDLSKLTLVSYQWVDEHVYAAIRGASVKILRRERQEGVGCRYKKINGKSVRYKIADIMSFLEAQPGGGGAVPGERAKCRPGRPRKVVL